MSGMLEKSGSWGSVNSRETLAALALPLYNPKFFSQLYTLKIFVDCYDVPT